MRREAETLKQWAAVRTLRLETRSAVSSSVSLLIWSTMSAILGFEGASAAAAAAASVELYRLDVAPRRSVCVGARRALVERNWRAQERAAYRQDMAIAVKEGIGSPGDAWLDGDEEETVSRLRFSRSLDGSP